MILWRRVSNFLQRPWVRYQYLLALRPHIAFDRKEEALATCFEYIAIAGVPGDYLEFGLWQGSNLVRAYYLSRSFTRLANIRLHGFDSFEGIPVVDDPVENELFPPGSLKGSYDNVVANLRWGRVDMSKVTLTKGWFSDTLVEATRASLGIERVAIAYIDCDVFESTVPVLNFLAPLLADGAVLIFDDWYSFKNKREYGQQRAFSEWLVRNVDLEATPYMNVGWGGKSFIVNKRTAASGSFEYPQQRPEAARPWLQTVRSSGE